MRNDARTDQQLVELARRGDHAAFRVLVEKYQRKMFAVALGIVRDRDDAFDLCQEAFLRAYRGLDRFEGDAQLFTWLYRILHNLAVDHLRRRRFQTVSIDDEDHALPIADESLDADPSRQLWCRDLCERIDDALARLTPAHREIVVLREVEGLSYKEIADAIGCSIGTVMSRLFHARKKLLKAIEAKQRPLDLAA